MKKIFVLVLLSHFYLNTFAQNFQWAKRMGGTDDDYAYSVAVDDSGNIYTAGYFEGQADFDPGPGTYNLTSVGSSDMFISKVDASGNFIWAKRIGGSGYEELNSFVLDSSGNIYCTGDFRGTVDFDPGADTFNLVSVGGANNDNIFIFKLDSSGNFRWAKMIGGNKPDVGHAVALDGKRNLYVTGWFAGTADFDPGVGISNLSTGTVGNPIMFMLKIDSSGKFIWARQIGDNADLVRGLALATDSSCNIYATGFLWGTGDFDPGTAKFNLTSTGLDDIFILKMDSSGNFVFAKSMGGGSSEQSVCIVLDKAGNIYTAGYFQGTSDFDPGAAVYNMASVGLNDIFVSKLNAAGNFVWAKSMGGAKNEQAYAIALDAFGNVYTTGGFSGTVDFDPGVGTFYLITSGISEIFLSKLDSSGNFVWAKNIGGADFARGQAITLDAARNIYTTGYFGGICDFDPGTGQYFMTPAGIHDIFILKLCSPPSSAGTINGPSAVCAGSAASFSVNSAFGATGYLWQVPSDASVLSGQNTKTVQVSFGISSGKIKVTSVNNCSSASPDSFSITVNPLPTISKQPIDQTIIKGHNVQFTTGTSNIASAFQWQQNTGTGFTNLSNAGQYSGVANDTLTITAVTLSQDNYKYRCIISEQGCSDTSSAAVLTVKDNSGINVSENENYFSIYPNPAMQQLTINPSTSPTTGNGPSYTKVSADNELTMENTSYTIVNVLGQKIMEGLLFGVATVINISSLHQGVYFFRVGDRIKMFVKE